jgi:hypothetical protein
MTANRPMTAAQAATLKRLAEAAYELGRGGSAYRDVDRQAQTAWRAAAHTLKRASQGLSVFALEYGRRLQARPTAAKKIPSSSLSIMVFSVA